MISFDFHYSLRKAEISLLKILNILETETTLSKQ